MIDDEDERDAIANADKEEQEEEGASLSDSKRWRRDDMGSCDDARVEEDDGQEMVAVTEDEDERGM